MIRYRLVDDLADDRKVRRRVVIRHGFEGFVERWTTRCSGCSDADYGFESGAGCRECGYTGKRRVAMFMPFDICAFETFLDRRWKRRERLLAFWARNPGDAK